MINYRPNTIRPSAQGNGQLITNASADGTGIGNYTLKVNFRRELDQEIRREGHDYFKPVNIPLTNLPLDQPLNVEEPIVLLHQLTRENGATALIAGTKTTLYRFDGPDGADYFAENADYMVDVNDYIEPMLTVGKWRVIGDNYSEDGNRWEAVNLGGYAIFNNGVDLPFCYRMEWDEVQPLYELRQQGVARVGTIETSNGILIVGDIVEIDQGYLINLLKGSDPYGPVTDESALFRTSYRILNSVVGDPRNWATELPATGYSGSPILEFEVEPVTFQVGDIIVIGSQQATIIHISGNTVVLDEVLLSDPFFTPVFRLADSVNIVGRYDLLDNVAQTILRIKTLKGRIIVYMDTEIYIGAFTGSLDAPFVWEKVYSGNGSVHFKNTLVEVNGQYHMYVGRSGFYTFDLTNQTPQFSPKFELFNNLLFNFHNIDQTNSIFAFVNSITNEIFFCLDEETASCFNIEGLDYNQSLAFTVECGDTIGVISPKTIAYDFKYDTISTVDVLFTSGASIKRPFTNLLRTEIEDWCILGFSNGVVGQYGKTAKQYEYYARFDQEYTSLLQSGIADFGQPYSQKAIRRWLLQLSSLSDVHPVQIKLNTYDNVLKVPTEVMDVTLTSAEAASNISCFLKGMYFQDIIIVSGKHNPVRLYGKIIDVGVINTKSIANIR